VDPSNFKTYEELAARLRLVAGEDDNPPFDVEPRASSTKKASAPTTNTKKVDVEDDENDEILARLRAEIAGHVD
jgi:hypothetical protein